MAQKYPKQSYPSAAVVTWAVSCTTKCLVEKNKNDFHTFETKNEWPYKISESLSKNQISGTSAKGFY